jgi:hypothetical protein
MSKRKIDRGRPLDEAVTKGSIDYTTRAIRSAFYSQFPEDWDSYEWLVIEEIFTDHVIVNSSELPHDEFYRVAYREENGRYIFDDREAWELVELTYQPANLMESLKGRSGQRIKETSAASAYLGEAEKEKPRRIFADVATADVVNGNNRRYSLAVLVEAVQEARQHLHESLSQGRAILLGEEDHPNSADKRSGPKLTETIVAWDDIWFDYDVNQVKVSGKMVENSRGRDAIVTMDAGVLPGVSLRGYGEAKKVKENGRSIEDVQWLRFTGVDLVMTPGFDEAAVTAIESKTEDEETMPKQIIEESQAHDVAVLTAEELLKKYPELAAQVHESLNEKERKEQERLRKIQEAEQREKEEIARQREATLREQLGIGETDDLGTAIADRDRELAELRAKETAREVAAFIESEIGKTSYPDFMKVQLREAIGEPTNVEEAKNALKRQRGIFDKIVSEMRLKAKGFGGVDVLGPVLEREGNVPAYAQAAHFINENLARRNPAGRPDPNRAPTLQEQLLAEYLESYDKAYKHHLIEEGRKFEEAMDTTDLSLPYSVMRAVIAQVYPQLLSPVIFDYGMLAQSPANIYYEKYQGETGETATVTGEEKAADHDAWVGLAQARLIPGTVTVVFVPASGANVPYAEGTDFVIDYELGRIMALSTGDIVDEATMTIGYQYRAMRLGEMQGIRRGKLQLESAIMVQAADRLAQQISREAVVFSRSQLGWDATSRTLTALVNEIAKKIDGDRLWKALAAALTVPNNSGGSWASSSGTLDDLVKYIGVAKTKVENRLYEATGVVVSKTRSETLSNWANFTSAGKRPDSDLNANGYVGRLKGLPVFETTQFPDNYILVMNREIVMARVFQPMQLFGPFPSYDSNGLLIAADQYYVEEFNGSLAPVPEKAAYVKIT